MERTIPTLFIKHILNNKNHLENIQKSGEHKLSFEWLSSYIGQTGRAFDKQIMLTYAWASFKLKDPKDEYPCISRFRVL